MVKKISGFLLAVVLLGAIVAGLGYFFGCNKDQSGAVVYNLISRQLPAAELATRTVVWQSVISENQNFPARHSVIGRTATIKAGFDLAKIDPAKDLLVDPEKRTITLRLPKAEILSLSWSSNRIITERHSVAAAVLHKSAEEENRRRKLFEEALRRDAQLYKILDFDSMNEGIVRYLAPIASQVNWKLVVQSEEHVDFAAALDAYLATHP